MEEGAISFRCRGTYVAHPSFGREDDARKWRDFLPVQILQIGDVVFCLEQFFWNFSLHMFGLG